MPTTWTRSIAYVLVCGLLAGSIRAEETAVEPPESVGEDLTPSVGDVIKGSSLVGTSVLDSDGADVGKVLDLFVDPYAARVVFLIVERTGTESRSRHLLIPTEAIAPLQDNSVKANVSLETIENDATSLTKAGSQPYTRRMSVATFRHYGINPYWQPKKGVIGQTKFDRDDQFIKLRDLRKRPVHEPSGKKLGIVHDVVVSRKDGRITYTLFQYNRTENGAAADQRAFPVPLAAFVVPPKTNKWSIELPEQLLDNMQAVQGDEYPAEISRAWVEYIHVRYGGGVFDGVQRENKAANK